MSDPLREGIDAGFRLGWKVALTVVSDELAAALAQAVTLGADRAEYGIQGTTIIDRLATLADGAPELAVVMAQVGEAPDEVLTRLGAPAGTVKH